MAVVIRQIATKRAGWVGGWLLPGVAFPFRRERSSAFWLEVESGNASRETLRRKTARRFERALAYTRRFSLFLVYTLLSPPWVRRAVVEIFVQMPGDAAVVLADWKAFGALSVPLWGAVLGG